MTPWTKTRVHLRGRVAVRKGQASADLLRAWAEGSREVVESVTDPDGAELAPADVDWTGMEPAPQRRGGRPTTGRTATVLVRLTPNERAAMEGRAVAAGVSLPEWVREQARRAAR